MHITSKLLLLLIILATNNGNAITCPNPDPNNNDDGIDSILRPFLMIGYPYMACGVFNNNDDKGDNLPREVTGAEFNGIRLVNALGAQVAHLTLKPFVLGGIFRFINSIIFNVEFSAVHDDQGIRPGIISFEGTTFMCTGRRNTRFFDNSRFKGYFSRITVDNQKRLGANCTFLEDSTLHDSEFNSANFLGSDDKDIDITSVDLSGSSFNKTKFNSVSISSFDDCQFFNNGNDCTSKLDGATFTGDDNSAELDAHDLLITDTSLINTKFNNFLGEVRIDNSDLTDSKVTTPRGDDSEWNISRSRVDKMQFVGNNNSHIKSLTIATSYTNNPQNGQGGNNFSITKMIIDNFNIFRDTKLNLDLEYSHIENIGIHGTPVQTQIYMLYNLIDNFFTNGVPVQERINLDNSTIECSMIDNMVWRYTSYHDVKLLTSMIAQDNISNSVGNFIIGNSEICPDPEDDGRNLVAALREAVDEGMPEALLERYQHALRGGIAAIDLNIGQPQQQGEGSGINVRANRAMVNPTLYGTVITIDTGKTLTIDHGNLHGVTINGLGTLILIGTTFDANSNVNVGTLIATHIINQTALTVLHATILYLSYILTKS